MLAADPLITEFMSSNGDALNDGYGATPDWIEIYNNGDQSVDLEDYSLTDNSGEIDKWQFPEVVLDPGQYLIVFASGIDAVDPGGNFHTNFGLSSEGDYLALADPQGTILSEFGPAGTDYPEQAPNVSYGLAFDSVFTEVVSATSGVKYQIPTDGSVDATWTDSAFDDSAWQTGVASLGYEETAGIFDDLIQTTLPQATESVYVRIPFTVADADAKIGTLRMKYDDGFVAYLNGVLIAQANAPVSVAFDSEATEFHVKEAAIEDVVFDISGHSDILQIGQNVLAIHLMDAANSPSQDLLLSPTLTVAAGVVAIPEAVGGLISPTPGLPNTQVVASDVVFSRAGGLFTTPFVLTLTPSVSGESIRYTTDGSVPEANSTPYTVPISINETTQIRARSFGTNGQMGNIQSEGYTLGTSEITAVTSDLPIIIIESFGSNIPGRAIQDAMLSLYETDALSNRSSLGESPDATSRVGYKRRGSSTFGAPKPNFRVEFRDEADRDKNVNLLDLPAESDWILYAPYTVDRSMLRNTVFYDLSGQAGRYAIRTRYVEVYHNGTNGVLEKSDYLGVYVLMENIKQGAGRVDIENLTPSDISEPEITGGYIIKVDRGDGQEDSSWETPNTLGDPKLVHVDPNREDLTADQVDYIRDYVSDFENALDGPNSTDPEIGYAAYIDVDSWIDHHLLRTFSKENDSLVLSEHLYKPRGGKLTFGPAWDFDRSSGSEGNDLGVDIWGRGGTGRVFHYGWWHDLFGDLNFKQQWVDRWQELRETIYSDANLTATVEGQADKINESQERNAARWPEAAPNGGVFAEVGLTGWDAEVSHFSGWLMARAAWMDDQMVAPPKLLIDPGNISGTGLLTLTPNPSGYDVYYTLNGSDPRADGGGISSDAILYTGPITLSESTQINARSFGNGSGVGLPWSRIDSGFFQAEESAGITNLRISELHYNPLDPTAGELLAVPGADNNDFEFIELINISEQPIHLHDVRFINGVTFDFTSGSISTLAAGETVLVVKNSEAFEARYGLGLSIAGEYAGKLSGKGEQVVLVDASDNVIHDFTYDDASPWPEAADGDGPSLEVIDLLGDLNDPSNWQASALDNGSPGDASAPLLGDYDRSGEVDQLDRIAWVNQYGDTVTQPGMGADGNRDGTIDAADYTVWRDHLGQTQALFQTLSTSVVVNYIPPTASEAVAKTNEESPFRFATIVTSGRQVPSNQPLLPETASLKKRTSQRWHDLAILIATDESVSTDFERSTIDTLLEEHASTEEYTDTAFLDWEAFQFPRLS